VPIELNLSMKGKISYLKQYFNPDFLGKLNIRLSKHIVRSM